MHSNGHPTLKILTDAKKNLQLTLDNTYIKHRGLYWRCSFFDMRNKVVTIERVYPKRHTPNIEDITFETFFTTTLLLRGVNFA